MTPDKGHLPSRGQLDRPERRKMKSHQSSDAGEGEDVPLGLLNVHISQEIHLLEE